MSETTVSIVGRDSKPFLSDDVRVGGSAVGVEAFGNKDLDVMLALKDNKPLPDRQIAMGEVRLGLKGGKDLQLRGGGAGKGNVTFAADARSGLGVYPDPTQLVAALGLDENLTRGFALPADPDSSYLLFYWAYDLAAGGKLSAGPAQLGSGVGASFGVDAKRGRLYAVVRRTAKTTGARTAVARAARSWTLPKRVEAATDLAPGTWVISEVDGSLGLELGLTWGYDYSWVRETRLGNLSGDLGLKIELAAKAKLGASFAGRFALVLGRESSEQTLRLRLFKLKKKGWSFALDMGAKVEPSTGSLTPERFEQFIAGIFGLDPAQLMEDLAALEKWTDPDKLPELLKGKLLAGVDKKYLFGLLQETTGIDPAASLAKFQAARQKILGLLGEWKALDQQVAARLWKIVGAGNMAEVEKVRKLAAAIASADAETVRGKLQEKFSDVAFFSTPEGEWLLSVAAGRLLDLAGPRLGELQKTAAKTAKILDPNKLLGPLRKLQQRIGKELRLDKIGEALNKPGVSDPAAAIDKWMAAKLARFVDEKKLTGKKLREINDGIEEFRSKGEEFYTKAVAALNKTYSFSLSATYQKNTSSTALIDAEFDFKNTAGDAGELLGQALRGDFKALLTQPSSAVTLREAALTHDISRQSHVKVSLPWGQKTSDWQNTASSKLLVEDDESGHLMAYSTTAKDRTVEAAKARFQRASTLVLTASLPKKLVGELRDHSAPGAEAYGYSYTLQQAQTNTLRRDLERRVGPYLQTYFGDQLAHLQGGGLDDWLVDLDKAVDDEHLGTGHLGPTFLSLQVSLEEAIVKAWFQSGLKAADYHNLSRALQRKLKELVYLYYFADINNLKVSPVTDAVLLYTVLQPFTHLGANGQEDKLTSKAPRAMFWDHLGGVRKKVEQHPKTRERLGRRLAEIHVRLLKHGKAKTAKRFDPALKVNYTRIQQPNASLAPVESLYINNLLWSESQLVKAAIGARRRFEKFDNTAATNPKAALATLARFSGDLTAVFNKMATNKIVGTALRPLGTMLFLEGALALNAALPAKTRKPSALLDFGVLKAGVAFDPKAYLAGTEPEAKDLFLRQMLASIQT